MRPLAFRVWDPERRRMRRPDELHFLYRDAWRQPALFPPPAPPPVAVKVGLRDPQGRGGLFDAERCPVMAYTGLDDAMGRPIYEGDLVTAPGDATVWAVAWAPGEFVLQSADGRRRRSLALYADQQRLGIIGNIHEQPELFAPPAP